MQIADGPAFVGSVVRRVAGGVGVVSLADLRVLLTVVEAGSLTAAGRHLGCSQSTVSRRLARLEEEYGTELVVRSGPNASVTRAGRDVLETATAMLDQHEALHRRLREHGPPLAGSIEVVTSTAPATFLPRLIAGFVERHPEVRFDVSIADSAAVHAAIAEGRAALGLSGTADEEDGRLEFVPFASDELLVVVPAEHRFARSRRVPLAELADEVFVLREAGSGTQWILREALLRAGLDPGDLRGSLVVGSAAAVVDAVRANLGIAVVSESAVPRHADDVLGVRLTPALTRNLWLVLATDRRAAPPRDAFVEYVRRARPPAARQLVGARRAAPVGRSRGRESNP